MDISFIISSSVQKDLQSFAQSLVRTPSFPGREEAAIRLVEQQMIALGYDEVTVDATGNVLGRIGNGPVSILFDAHVDTVEVPDAGEWAIPPFSGEIADGRLHGRGSVDMKSAVAAAVFAGALARDSGFTEGITVYVSCTVMEEDCDGENLKHLFRERQLRPDAVVICEPSSNTLMLGHKGKAQVRISTKGVSAHGAAPDKGVNAIYEMAEIIQRVEKRNAELATMPGIKRTLVLSQITSAGASLNAVPSECTIYLDRRMAPGEAAEDIRREMDALIAGKNAEWRFGTLHRKSWTGMDVQYEPFHLAWQIEQEHPLTQACIAAYQHCFNKEPEAFGFWDFSTNAVTPVSMGIPTIGFGPGDYRMAHMRDESCPVQEIEEACRFYAMLVKHLTT